MAFSLVESASAVKLKFGVKADVLFSKFVTDYKAPMLNWVDVPLQPYSSDTYYGISGLAELKIDIWKGFGVDTGLGFANIGGNSNWGGMYLEGSVRVYDLTMTMYYLYVPVCLRYRLDIPAVESIVSPSIFTGPTVMFKVSEKRMISEDVSSLVFALKAGISLLFKKHIEVSASYNISLNNAFGFDARLSSNQIGHVNNKLSYWSLGLGYVW